MKLGYEAVIVITGPSGVGKGTLIQKLRERIPGLGYSVSATTRLPREGEEDGVDYHFIAAEQFAEMVKSGEFVEHAAYAGRQYGTPKAEIERNLVEGKPVILEVELEGARQIKESLPQALRIFIAPPAFDTLRDRLTGRGKDTAMEVEKRLEIAKRELEARAEFDVEVVNDDLKTAVDELERIIRDRLPSLD